MHARHQAAPGGSAHRAGRIEVGQLHALLGHAVHARGLELFLSEAGKIPVPRIVDHDVNEVRLAGGGLEKDEKQGTQAEKEGNGFHGSGCGLKDEGIIEKGMDRGVTKKHQSTERNLFRAFESITLGSRKAWHSFEEAIRHALQ